MTKKGKKSPAEKCQKKIEKKKKKKSKRIAKMLYDVE